jgi:DNA gyrase subunit A
MMRAKVHIEQAPGGKNAIVVTEIPYQVNKVTLMKRIADLINEKVIDDIDGSNFRDESDRDGMRIYIPLKRGAEHQIVLNQLHKHTQMQESFSMIFLAVHNGQPKELPLDQAIRAFLDHRSEVVRRRTAFLLNKARDREHILLGYQIALDHLDNVIKIIRQSNSRADARENLFGYFSNKKISLRGTELKGVTLDPAKYAVDTTFLPTNAAGQATLILSYRQIDAILELQLYRLTQLSIDELLNELKQVRENIAEFESILASAAKLRKVIIKELTEIRDRYGDARRTQIVDETTELSLEDLIADEQVAVTVSNTGYLKRTPISTYRQQRRGGTGRLGMKTREEDFVAQLIIESTHAYLLCFTNTGRVYWVKVYDIPDVGAAGKGKAIGSLIDLQPGEKVVTILGVRDLEEENKYILFATRNGTVKKTALKDFSNVMSRGIIAINIEKEDELVCARVTDGHQIIFLATHEGMAIRFHEQDLRPMGRPATGNRGINLRKGDYVIGAAVTPSTESTNNRRLEIAARLGLTKEAEKVIEEATESAAAQPLELAEPGELGAPEVSEEALERLAKLDEKLGITPCLILAVSENGYGKRTSVDAYRLQSRGGKGVISMKTTPKIGKVSAINLVDETTEMMLISQFGKIIRIDTKTIRSAGRSTSGVKLLNLDQDDKVAAAVVIPPDDKPTTENGTLLQ